MDRATAGIAASKTGAVATKLAGSAAEQVKSNPIMGGGAAVLLLLLIILFYLAIAFGLAPDVLTSKAEDTQFLKTYPAERDGQVQRIFDLDNIYEHEKEVDPNSAATNGALSDLRRAQGKLANLDQAAKDAQDRLGAGADADATLHQNDASQAAEVSKNK